MAKINKKDFDKNVDDQVRAHNLLIELQKKEYEGLTHIFSLESQRAKALLDLQQTENERNVRFQEYSKMVEDRNKGLVTFSKTTLTSIEKQLKKEQDHINKLKAKEKVLRSISSIKFPDFIAAANALNIFNDKPIRETIQQIGMGAEKGQMIRDSFYEALPKAALLGASMKDLQTIQQAYTEESGRALSMTSQQLVNVTEIGKGLGIGVDGATKLVAQFEMLGMDTQRAHETIQGIVDSSERMGINVNKVLKNVSANFKQLNTFAFKDGIKGMAKMAQYAEKFKIDLNASINSADQARTLDGAIEMASQLQILGGEFTKADPFEMFHLSRNDPAKYTQKLNEMVKGMSSLVKTADGFKLSTSPQDLDRLRLAAEAMGVPFENLVEQSERFAEMQAMNRQMMGTAFSKEDRETIQAMAKLDSKSGVYKVLGKDISKLSKQEVESLKVQQTTLKQRAEAAQTFDEKFNNTIQSMKYTLLPILDGINAIFDTIHPYLKAISGWMQSMPDWTKTGLKWIGGLAGAGIALGMAGNVIKSIPGIGMLGKLFSGGSGKATPTGGAGGGVAGAMGGGGKGAFGAGAGAGAKLLGAGAGIGLASAGMGAGINLAAQGISKLADSMSKLDKDQVEALKTIAVTLAVSFPLAAIGIGILAAVAAPAAIPLLALGAAIFGIGAGIGIAAAGIGYMAKGFSTLLTSASPQKVFALAAGITTLGGAMTTLAGGSVLALFTGAGPFAMLGLLSTRAEKFERIGNAMKNIAVVLNSNGEGLSRLKETLDSISNVNAKGGVFAEIKEMMKNGLKVKFDEKNVSMNVNISLEVDSEVLARKTAKKIVVLHKDYQNGKAG